MIKQQIAWQSDFETTQQQQRQQRQQQLHLPTASTTAIKEIHLHAIGFFRIHQVPPSILYIFFVYLLSHLTVTFFNFVYFSFPCVCTAIPARFTFPYSCVCMYALVFAFVIFYNKYFWLWFQWVWKSNSNCESKSESVSWEQIPLCISL